MRLLRGGLQFAFLTLTLYAVFVAGGNAERWCPFGGVEALYTYASEGNMPCSLGISNFFILAAVLLMALLLKRAFCGYVCPIGAISEWLGRAGRVLGLPILRVGGGTAVWLDRLKYLTLVLILFVTYRAGELHFRVCDPCYALISRHGEDITVWAYIVAGAIIVASLFVALPFCRWLCPLAAVLQPFSRLAATGIRRHPGACIDCGECTQACLMQIDVARATGVHAGDCTACMECTRACPVPGGTALTWGPIGSARRHWPRPSVAVVVLVLIAGAAWGAALSPLPAFTYERGAPTEEVERIELELTELTCRGRATLLTFYLDRDDEYSLGDYIRLEAWPGPGASRVGIAFDAAVASPLLVKQAITEPYYNAAEGLWRAPPYSIAGYDPFE